MLHFIGGKGYVSAAAQYFICDDLSYLRLIQTYMYFTADTLSSSFDCFVRLCSFDAWRGYLSICKTINVG